MTTTHGLKSDFREVQAFFSDTMLGYVESGGLPTVPASSLTLDAFATNAYCEDSGSLAYVAQPSATLGPLTAGDGSYFLALHKSQSNTPVAGWTRTFGTHYLWILANTQPVNPPGGLVFSKVTVAGGVITVVENFAYRSPMDAIRGEHSVASWGASGGATAAANSQAIGNAITAAQVTRGKVTFPVNRSILAYNIDSGFTINQPIVIESHGVGVVGDGAGPSAFIDTASDITVFTVTRSASGTVIRGLYLRSLGTSTLPGIRYENSNTNLIDRCTVTQFNVGVQYSPGSAAPFSSFLNTINDSNIIQNTAINIEGQSQTNSLRLAGVTFGGGSSAVGLKLLDSGDLHLFGGDVEGTTSVAIDLDSTTNDFRVGHLIAGTHIEANTASNGDIRIGATGSLDGITIVGCIFVPAGTSDSAINAISGRGLIVSGGALHSGYSGANLSHIGFARISAAFNDYAIIGVAGVQNDVGINYRSGSASIFSPATDFDADYEDCAQYNLYKIGAEDVVANQHYYSHLSVMRTDGTVGNPGAGHSQYAIGALAFNGHGSAANVRALRVLGAFDMNNVTVPFGSSMTPDTSQGNNFIISISSAIANTINNPVNPETGQVITFTLRNVSGGAAGVTTWGSAFKLSPWSNAVNGNSLSITYRYDGTNWVEISRTPVQVPN